MAWYNRILGINEPKKKKRQAYRRSYTGANTGRLFADFVTTSTSADAEIKDCLLYTSPSPRDRTRSRMPSSA